MKTEILQKLIDEKQHDLNKLIRTNENTLKKIEAIKETITFLEGLNNKK